MPALHATRPVRPATTPAMRRLLLVVEYAPALPDSLHRQVTTLAHGRGDDADSALAALLSRPEVDLEPLRELCAETAHRHPAARAAYLARPEHTAATLAELVAADPREEVFANVVTARQPNHRACAAVTAAARDPYVLFTVVTRDELPAQLRADTYLRLWKVLPVTPKHRNDPCRDDLLAGTGSLPPEVVNTVALSTDNQAILLGCATRLTAPAAAAAVAEHLLIPLLTGAAPSSRLKAMTSLGHQLLDATRRVGALLDVEQRERLAALWEQPLPDTVRPGTSHTFDDHCEAVLEDLRLLDITDRAWLRQARDDGFDRRKTGLVALAAHLTSELGDDPQAWATYAGICGAFRGTVGELTMVVKGATQGP